MGIDYAATLVFGLWFDDVPENIKQDYENLQLEMVPTYYDAPNKDCILGKIVYISEDYSALEIDYNAIADDIREAREEFENICNMNGNLYLATYGC